MKPGFRVTANGGDITATVSDRLVSLRLTDEAGIESDTLEVTLADTPTPIQLPPTGAELEVALGYDGALTRMGLFVVDELELSGWPQALTIRARAAVTTRSKGGQVDLQTQKTRSWDQGTTIGDMVKKVASEHGLKPQVAASLASIALPHTDQTRESDLHLLQRIAARHDAVLKAAGGTLALTKRGEGKTASGQDLKPVAIDATQCVSYRATIAKRDAPGTVKAYWQNTGEAARKEEKVGDGDPVRQLRQIYPSQDAAKQAAQAELNRRARGERQLTLVLPGDPAIVAEAPLTTTGFRSGVDGDWIITRVEHALDASGGYQVTIDAEAKPAG